MQLLDNLCTVSLKSLHNTGRVFFLRYLLYSSSDTPQNNSVEFLNICQNYRLPPPALCSPSCLAMSAMHPLRHIFLTYDCFRVLYHSIIVPLLISSLVVTPLCDSFSPTLSNSPESSLRRQQGVRTRWRGNTRKTGHLTSCKNYLNC